MFRTWSPTNFVTICSCPTEPDLSEDLSLAAYEKSTKTAEASSVLDKPKESERHGVPINASNLFVLITGR